MRKLTDENLRLVNLTPHAINLEKDGEILTIEPSGIVTRVEMVNSKSTEEEFVTNATALAIIDLPKPQENTYFITSMIVAQATERKDVLAPDTNNATRNESGHIVSVPGLVRYIK